MVIDAANDETVYLFETNLTVDFDSRFGRLESPLTVKQTNACKKPSPDTTG